MSISLQQVSAYLPYGLKCQYWGIINGKVLSLEHRQFEKDGHPFDFTEAEFGLKIGTLKEIKVFKNYWKCYIGNSGRALKSFYDGGEFKPVLRPISDLFNDKLNPVPINELKSIYGWDYLFYDVYKKKEPFNINALKHACLIKLLEHHFDVFGLIEKGLALDKNNY